MLKSPTDGGRSVSLTGNVATHSKGVACTQACTQPVILHISPRHVPGLSQLICCWCVRILCAAQATEELYDRWYELQLLVLPFVTLLDTKRFIIMLCNLFLWGCGITVGLMIPGAPYGSARACMPGVHLGRWS
jgi:hypothetical protein